MCLAPAEKDRPKEFKSDEGSFARLVTLSRAPEKKADKRAGPDLVGASSQEVALVDEQVAAPAKSTEPQKVEQPAPPMTDSQKLVGTWKFVKARTEGADLPQDIFGSVRLTFDADGKVQVKGTPHGSDNGFYKLDPGQGHLDLTVDQTKEQVLGIYRFQGDQLTICFSEDAKAKIRPKEFAAEAGNKQILMVLERATPLEVTVGGGPGEPGRQQDANNIKQILLSFHNYHDTFGHFPLHAIYSKDGKKALLSWRVAILPYIEQNALYLQFKLDEPWDSEHNKKLIDQMPPLYRALGKGKKGEGLTYYVVFTGPHTPFNGAKKITFVDFTDGTSNTAILFEANDPVLWTKPDDLVLPKEGDKLPELGGMFSNGMNLGFADGSVRWVRRDIDPKTLRALITHQGGEIIDESKLAPPREEPAKVKAPAAEPVRQDANNLKQIMLAFHSYHDVYKHFPQQAIMSKDGKPLLSWRVAILPFIDQGNLYNQFKLDEPWDSEHNKKLINIIPKTYLAVANAPKEPSRTYYQVFTGKDTLYPTPDAKVTIGQITDGTSQTACIFEAKEPVIWTKPDDLVLPKQGEKMPDLGGMFPDGMNLAFCDGSVRWVRRDIDPATLRALITPAGGEVIDQSKLAVPPAKKETPPPEKK
jgi:uncharacterized protein (TIGR03067 family)/prepilin-type processing-associated H-X9-DG protein